MEKTPIPQNPSGSIEKDTKKSNKSEELVLAQITKPMTGQQILEEMEKQGLRSVTIEELKTFLENAEGRIEPKDSDIIGEKE